MDAINDIAERASYDRPIRNRFYTALCAKHHDQEPGTNDKRKKQEALDAEQRERKIAARKEKMKEMYKADPDFDVDKLNDEEEDALRATSKARLFLAE